MNKKIILHKMKRNHKLILFFKDENEK